MRDLFGSRLVVAAVSALIGAGIVGAVWGLTDSGDGKKRDGKVKLSFEPGPAEPVKLVQRSGAFARAVRTMNEEINLPTDLHVRVIGDDTAARVGAGGPTYEPSNHTVYYPWSWLEGSHRDLDGLRRKGKIPSHEDEDRVLTHAAVFVLYHEVSHGLFDVLDVPVVGGEEANADSLAAILAIVSRAGEEVPLGAGVLEEAKAERSGGPTGIADYADDHGFDRQREFNVLCFVYGATPRRHRELVGGEGLPSERADLCPFTYKQELRSWRRLLAEWLTHGGGLLPET